MCLFRFRDELQLREPGLKECDDTNEQDEEVTKRRRKDSSGSGGTMGILRRAYRCISSGAIPTPADNRQSASGKSTAATSVPPAEPDDSSYYQSYSCDDLYLAAEDDSADEPRGVEGQLRGQEPDAEVRRGVRTQRCDEVRPFHLACASHRNGRVHSSRGQMRLRCRLATGFVSATTPCRDAGSMWNARKASSESLKRPRRRKVRLSATRDFRRVSRPDVCTGRRDMVTIASHDRLLRIAP